MNLIGTVQQLVRMKLLLPVENGLPCDENVHPPLSAVCSWIMRHSRNIGRQADGMYLIISYFPKILDPCYFERVLAAERWRHVAADDDTFTLTGATTRE